MSHRRSRQKLSSSSPPNSSPQKLSLIDRIRADPDIIGPLREAKRQSFKIICGTLVFLLFLIAQGIAAVVIHLLIMKAHSLKWKMESWIDWADSQGLSIYFGLMIAESLILIMIVAYRLIKSERKEEKELSPAKEPASHNHESD